MGTNKMDVRRDENNMSKQSKAIVSGNGIIPYVARACYLSRRPEGRRNGGVSKVTTIKRTM